MSSILDIWQNRLPISEKPQQVNRLFVFTLANESPFFYRSWQLKGQYAMAMFLILQLLPNLHA